MDKPISVIMNPGAGRYDIELVDAIEAILPDAKPSHTKIVFNQESTYNLLPENSNIERVVTDTIENDGVRDLVVVGGDGTLHHAVNGVMNSGVNPAEFTISAVPSGTGNDFSSGALGIKTVEEGLKVIADYYGKRNIKNIGAADVLLAESGEFSRHYISMADAAFGAYLANWVINHPGLKSLLKGLVYHAGVILSYSGYEPQNMELRFDDGPMFNEYNVFLANALNGTDAGGGMFLTPEAVVDDGFLDLIVGSNTKLIPLLNLLLKASTRKETETDPRVRYVRNIEKVRMKLHDGGLFRRVNLDGELLKISDPREDMEYRVTDYSVNFLSK